MMSNARQRASFCNQFCARHSVRVFDKLELRQLAENPMVHNYWSDWYFGWGWMLWFGFVFLIFSGIGNWGYTYRAHQKYDLPPRKEASDILNERYARGDITREQYVQLKSDIAVA
jgi:putative membrane protein